MRFSYPKPPLKVYRSLNSRTSRYNYLVYNRTVCPNVLSLSLVLQKHRSNRMKLRHRQYLYFILFVALAFLQIVLGTKITYKITYIHLKILKVNKKSRVESCFYFFSFFYSLREQGKLYVHGILRNICFTLSKHTKYKHVTKLSRNVTRGIYFPQMF